MNGSSATVVLLLVLIVSLVGPSTAGAAPPIRIVIPRIEVDVPVVKASLLDGDWKVPAFAAGHLEGTDDPGPTGNVALSGHVTSTNAGNVFVRLGELKVGDKILVTDEGDFPYEYEVTEILVVENKDFSVLKSTPEPRLTLITCIGDWLPAEWDYSHRLVVVAQAQEGGTTEQ